MPRTGTTQRTVEAPREHDRPLHRRGDLPAAARRLPRARRGAGRRPARARRRHHRPGQRARREPRADVRRRVHRDVCAVGGSVHRRPRRLPHAARGRAADRVAARGGRQHDPLPPAQGNRLGARAARRRRHRLARARRRVLRAARDDAVHEPRAPARSGDRRPAGRGAPRARRHVPGWSVRLVRPHRRDAARRRALGSLQHPEHRHLPVARGVAPSHALAARRRRRLGTALPLRPARDGQAPLRAEARPSRRSPTSPSRSTCRCR